MSMYGPLLFLRFIMCPGNRCVVGQYARVWVQAQDMNIKLNEGVNERIVHAICEYAYLLRLDADLAVDLVLFLQNAQVEEWFESDPRFAITTQLKAALNPGHDRYLCLAAAFLKNAGYSAQDWWFNLQTFLAGRLAENLYLEDDSCDLPSTFGRVDELPVLFTEK